MASGNFIFISWIALASVLQVMCIDTWTPMRNMTTPRARHAVAALSESTSTIVYVIGGINNTSDITTPLDTVETYDVQSNLWSVGTSLPVGVHSASATSYNGSIYLLGGFTAGNEATSAFWQFDTVLKQWKSLPNMLTPRGGLSSQWINNKLYAIGGLNVQRNGSLSVNEVFDVETFLWRSITPMPTPRHYLVSAVWSGQLFAIGGRNPGNVHTNEAYNPTTDTWQSKNPMPSERGDCSGGIVGDRIFVFGGSGQQGTFDNTEEYGISLNEWKCRTETPVPLYGSGAVAVAGDKLVVVGGAENALVVEGRNFTFLYAPSAAELPGDCGERFVSSAATFFSWHWMALIISLFFTSAH